MIRTTFRTMFASTCLQTVVWPTNYTCVDVLLLLFLPHYAQLTVVLSHILFLSSLRTSRFHMAKLYLTCLPDRQSGMLEDVTYTAANNWVCEHSLWRVNMQLTQAIVTGPHKTRWELDLTRTLLSHGLCVSVSGARTLHSCLHYPDTDSEDDQKHTTSFIRI